MPAKQTLLTMDDSQPGIDRPFLQRDWLARARQGDGEALGKLLQAYRQYIELMARLQLDRELRQKIAPSDVAQETFVQAHRCFHQFEGATEAELLGWLRKIVANQLAMHVRRYRTQQRDVRLERSLADSLDHTSKRLVDRLRSPGSSPSDGASRREQAVILANALAQLRPDYRDVIILRHLEDREFAEIALQTGKTVDSVKNTWARAIGKLREIVVAP
jgi:RNA polymerase sigma-70 factor (ECF subfamily)